MSHTHLAGGCPAHFDPDRGVWVVDDPRYVARVLQNPATFPPDNALTAYTPLTRPSLRALAAADFALPPILASNSSDSHRSVRATVARFLSAARVRAVEPLIHEVTAEALEALAAALAAGGTADLVALVADRVPARAAFALFDLGAPPPELKQWSQDSLELFWGTPDPARQLVVARSAASYYRWLRMQTMLTRETAGADLFSALIRIGLDDDEVCAAAYFLLIAGQETTSMLIATILLRLLRPASGWRRAGTDRAVAAEAVEDALREESSVPTWRRATRAPVRLDGVDLPARASLLLTLTGTGGPANLAFGIGVHRCLGAALARLESTIVVHRTTAAEPELVLVEHDPPWVRLLSFAAPTRVLVRRGPG